MTRQTKISLLTSGVLVLSLLHYFFIYAEGRKDMLHRQNYRVLTKIAENIEKKFFSLRESARNQKDSTNILPLFEKVERRELDSIKRGEAYMFEEFRESLKYTNSLISKGGEGYFVFISDEINIVMSLKLERLMSGLLRDTYFDEYLLFRNDTTVFSTLTAAYNGVTLQKNTENDFPKIVKGGSEFLYYEQPVRMGDEARWVLVGLRDTKAFTVEQYRVSPFIILVLIILFLVFTAGMPFLKLMLLGKKEQLDYRDILYTSCGVVLGTMLITLLFLDIFDYTFSKKTKIDHNLSELSETVSSNFTAELNDMYRQLKQVNWQYVRKGEEPVEITSYLATLDSTVFYPYFIQANWMGKDGSQESFPKWTTRSNTTAKINVGERFYFKGLQDQQNYLRVGDMQPGEGFVLDQIISWNTGEYLTVMGYPCWRVDDVTILEKPYGAAMTTRLISVTDPVVPEGYSFAIINETGKVLYHSDSERSFHENLFDESQQNSALRSAVYSRQQKHFNIQYQSKPHRAYASPVGDTPYTIVALVEMEYYRTANMMTLTAVAMMAMLLFSLYGLQFFVKRIITYRKSLLEYRIPQFNWLRPDRSLDFQYTKLAIAHILHILVLLTFVGYMYHCSRPEHIIPLLYLAPSVTTYFSYFSLSAKGWYQNVREDTGLVVAVSLAALMVVASSYRIYGLYAMYELLVYLVVAWFMYQLVLFTSDRVGIRYRGRNKQFWRIIKLRYYRNPNLYYLFMLSFMVIIAVVPVTGFYIAAHNQEARIANAYHLLTFAEKIEDKAGWFYEIAGNRKGLEKAIGTYFDRSVYPFSDMEVFLPEELSQGLAAFTSIDTVRHKIILRDTTRHDSTLLKMLSVIRPFYNELVVRNNGLMYERASDNSYQLCSDAEDSKKRYLLLSAIDPSRQVGVAGEIDVYNPFQIKRVLT